VKCVRFCSSSLDGVNFHAVAQFGSVAVVRRQIAASRSTSPRPRNSWERITRVLKRILIAGHHIPNRSRSLTHFLKDSLNQIRHPLKSSARPDRELRRHSEPERAHILDNKLSDIMIVPTLVQGRYSEFESPHRIYRTRIVRIELTKAQKYLIIFCSDLTPIFCDKYPFATKSLSYFRREFRWNEPNGEERKPSALHKISRSSVFVWCCRRR
jgi:hypothetical protein